MTSETYSRRSVLRTGAGSALAGTAVTASPARAAPSFDGWFDGVSNYDGVVDETGQSEVTVEVGAQANGGSFGFGPAAVHVDPGTTVTWEWVAGNHNVVDDAGDFESEMTAEEGFTFSQTFDSAGVTKYYCGPHEQMGMRGAVVVGDVSPGGSGGADGASGSSDGGGEGSESGSSDGAATDGGGSGSSSGLSGADWATVAFAVSLVSGLLSPLAFAAFVDGEDDA